MFFKQYAELWSQSTPKIKMKPIHLLWTVWKRPKSFHIAFGFLPPIRKHYHSSRILFQEETASKGKQDPKLRSKIMLLYKKVHPDFFSEYPEEQKINQKSLQIFQNFLDDYQGFLVNVPENQKIYKRNTFFGNRYPLEFYIYTSSTSSKDELSSTRTLKHIQINLVGPQPNLGIIEKSNQLKLNLQKLFRSLEVLNPDETKQQQDDDYILGEDTSIDTSSLLQFLHTNQEKILHSMHTVGFCSREAEIKVHLLRHKIAEYIGAQTLKFDVYTHDHVKQYEIINSIIHHLNHIYKVDTSDWLEKDFVSFRNLLQRASKAGGIENLQHEVEYLHEDIYYIRKRAHKTPIHIAFGESKIHESGHIVLGLSETVGQWFYYLTNTFSPEEVLRKRSRKDHLRSLEKKFATELGISSWVTDSEYTFLSTKYERLLHEFDKQLATLQIKKTLHGKNCIVVIRDTDPTEERLKIHPKYGFVLASSDCTPQEIAMFLNANAEDSGFKYKNQQQKQKDVENLLFQTARELNLMYLDCVENLTLKQVATCCQTLLQNAEELTPALKNLHLCISDAFHVRSDGVVEIHWNFLFGNPSN